MKVVCYIHSILLIACIYGCYIRSDPPDGDLGDYLDFELADAYEATEEEVLDQELAEEPSVEEDMYESDSIRHCMFNNDVIWIGMDVTGCEGEMVTDIECRVLDIQNGEILLYNDYYGNIEIIANALSKENIEYSLHIGDMIKYIQIEYPEREQCIRGIVILRNNGAVDCIAIFLRYGDLNNPWYPIISNEEFHDVLPLDVEKVEDDCIVTPDAVPGCAIQQVYGLQFTNSRGDSLILSQGQSEIFDNGMEGADRQIYKIANNYSYLSENCGGEQTGYFVQIFDPSSACIE